MTRKIYQQILSERPLRGGSRVEFTFRTLGDAIPGVLLLPERQPAPAALLLHGLWSRKEDLADGVGRALLRRGVASLALDLPRHGARADRVMATPDPLAFFRLWRQALGEADTALHYLRARAETDGSRLAVAGYSLGSYLALGLAPKARVRAIVVAAGGDLPSGPMSAIARGVIDPLALVRRLNGTPLLMVHGRADRTVTPQQAERLYAAAGDPKAIRWWDAGHRLPAEAIEDAAAWLAERLEAGAPEA